MLSGKIFAFIIVSVIGNFYGKKNLIISGIVTSIFGFLLSLLTNTIFLVSFGLFIALLGIQTSIALSYVFLSEKVGED